MCAGWLLAIFFFAGYSLSQNNCPAQVCSTKVGETCAQSTSSFTICSGAENLYCNYEANSTCKTIAGVGQPCAPVNFGECGNNKCLPVVLGTYECSAAYLYPGQNCTSDKECIFTQSNGGSSSTCVHGKCHALLEGDKCSDPMAQCGAGLYCEPTGGTCQKLFPEGKACTSPTQCEQAYLQDVSLVTCVPTNGNDWKCGKLYQGKKGDYCRYLSIYCQDGYYCSSNSTCQPAFTPSNNKCQANADCPKEEECDCDYVSSEMTCQVVNGGIVASGTLKAFSDHFACLQANPICRGTPCAACTKQTCEVYELFKNTFDSGDYCSFTAEEMAIFKQCKN